MSVHSETWYEFCSLTQLKGILQLYNVKYKVDMKKEEIKQLVHDAKINLDTTVITNLPLSIVITVESSEIDED